MFESLSLLRGPASFRRSRKRYERGASLMISNVLNCMLIRLIGGRETMDWLSHLLEMLPVRGYLDLRCEYRVPWRLEVDRAKSGEIPYHVVLRGTTVLKGIRGSSPISLVEGDIL